MRIETTHFLKQNADSLELDEPLVITRNGKAVYRIEAEQQARIRDRGIALLKLMNIAERDINAGKTLTSEAAKARLRESLRLGKFDLNGDA